MSDREKPSVTFYVCVVLTGLFIALVVYPLSEAPVWRLYAELDSPVWLNTTMDYVYLPWNYVESRSPNWFRNATYSYFYWWNPGYPRGVSFESFGA